MASKSDVGWLALLHLRTNESIFSLESLVGEGRFHAVRFFGKTSRCRDSFLFDGYLMNWVSRSDILRKVKVSNSVEKVTDAPICKIS